MGSSRIMDIFCSVPPVPPKVFLVRTYVRAVRKPQPDGAIGGGRTANQGLDPLIYNYYARTGLVWIRRWLYWLMNCSA